MWYGLDCVYGAQPRHESNINLHCPQRRVQGKTGSHVSLLGGGCTVCMVLLDDASFFPCCWWWAEDQRPPLPLTLKIKCLCSQALGLFIAVCFLRGVGRLDLLGTCTSSRHTVASNSGTIQHKVHVYQQAEIKLLQDLLFCISWVKSASYFMFIFYAHIY